ncbi:MAG: sigma-54-dependent Fis family transcriptional regulator, partial [Aquifex sp.]
MILLIEDDNSLRELLKKKLQEHFVVDTAKDGETARKKLSKNNYDVVLLDIRLPDVDGTELLKEFSRNGV